MTIDEKDLARTKFRLRVHESNGSIFQKLFIDVMTLSDKGFEPVHPHGQDGDEKNDGFNRQTGEYYQVYSPENVGKTTYLQAISKARRDFKGLKAYWNHVKPIEKFYFVLNEKYNGGYPDLTKELVNIERENPPTKCFTFYAKDLEEHFLSLSDSDIVSVVGIIPSPNKITQIQFDAMSEVVEHLLRNKKPYKHVDMTNLPDLTTKIQFNGLSDSIALLLNTAGYQISVLDDYFQSNSLYLKDELREIFNRYYQNARKKYHGTQGGQDLMFFDILDAACPTGDSRVQDGVLVLMSHYFETCDIYEEPKNAVA